MQNNNSYVIYFYSFSVEHISNEIKAFISNNKNIATNTFRTQTYDSKMCGYFCIGFIDFKPADNFKKNDDVILNCFMSNN